MSIAIDGTMASGKGVVAKQLAYDMGYIYVDTGAMYRAVALYCIEKNIPLGDKELIGTHLDNISIDIGYVNGNMHIFLNNEDVSEKIRTREAGAGSSEVAVHGNVREKLVELQRKMASKKNVVMDGRDIGSYVLPNAKLKIYLDADVVTRAKRRHKDLIEKGENVTLEDIKNDIIVRDERDISREISPLVRAEDAFFIDTSDMTIDEVVEAIKNLYSIH